MKNILKGAISTFSKELAEKIKSWPDQKKANKQIPESLKCC